MLENKKPILIVSAILIVTGLAIAFIFLQNDRSKDRGSLTGTVTDASDDSHLQGVDVSAIDQDGVHYTSREYTAVSDTDGSFRLELPPNEYTLVLEADGYQPFKSSDTYTVESGEKLEVKEAFQLVSTGSSDPEVLSYEGSTAENPSLMKNSPDNTAQYQTAAGQNANLPDGYTDAAGQSSGISGQYPAGSNMTTASSGQYPVQTEVKPDTSAAYPDASARAQYPSSGYESAAGRPSASSKSDHSSSSRPSKSSASSEKSRSYSGDDSYDDSDDSPAVRTVNYVTKKDRVYNDDTTKEEAVGPRNSREDVQKEIQEKAAPTKDASADEDSRADVSDDEEPEVDIPDDEDADIDVPEDENEDYDFSEEDDTDVDFPEDEDEDFDFPEEDDIDTDLPDDEDPEVDVPDDEDNDIDLSDDEDTDTSDETPDHDDEDADTSDPDPDTSDTSSEGSTDSSSESATDSSSEEAADSRKDGTADSSGKDATDQNAPEEDSPAYPEDSLVYKGHHYAIFFEIQTDSDAAKKECVKKGGLLVVIDDSSEEKALNQYMTDKDLDPETFDDGVFVRPEDDSEDKAEGEIYAYMCEWDF